MLKKMKIRINCFTMLMTMYQANMTYAYAKKIRIMWKTNNILFPNLRITLILTSFIKKLKINLPYDNHKILIITRYLL
jgi:hypothetical protein